MLLADDHAIVRRGLRGLLESAGYAVVAEAADGLEAVRLCEEQQPDTMILDIAMPRLSGIEVAARAAKRERPPGVIERILKDDATVCGADNPVAFAKLRQLMLMYFAHRKKSVQALGHVQTAKIE